MVTRVLERVQLAKRALREITLLRHFASHENITGLIDVDAVSPEFGEMFVVCLFASFCVLQHALDTYLWRYEFKLLSLTRSYGDVATPANGRLATQRMTHSHFD